MSRNKRLALLIAVLLASCLAALLVLYVPLRQASQRMERQDEMAETEEAVAWPEADELDRYLGVREALFPLYEEHGETMLVPYEPLIPHHQARPFRILFAARRVSEVMHAALQNRDMTYPRYQELTDLVYYRWWRAASGEPPPERGLVERMETFRSRWATKDRSAMPEALRKDVEEKLAKLEEEKVRLAPLAEPDVPAILAAIPPEVLALLEARRDRIAANDMGLFDSHYLLPEDNVGAQDEDSTSTATE